MHRRNIIRRFFIVVLILTGFISGYFGLNDFRKDGHYSAQAGMSAAERAIIEPNKYYKVTDVVDGDTFKARIDGEEITVRLLGINTPEVVDPRKPVECFGPEASAETKSLLNNREVRLVLNPAREKTDKYGRLLAYSYRDDGLFLNKFLVQQGFAREYTVGKAYQYQKEFRADQKTAKANSLGLWGKCITSP